MIIHKVVLVKPQPTYFSWTLHFVQSCIWNQFQPSTSSTHTTLETSPGKTLFKIQQSYFSLKNLQTNYITDLFSCTLHILATSHLLCGSHLKVLLNMHNVQCSLGTTFLNKKSRTKKFFVNISPRKLTLSGFRQMPRFWKIAQD